LHGPPSRTKRAKRKAAPVAADGGGGGARAVHPRSRFGTRVALAGRLSAGRADRGRSRRRVVRAGTAASALRPGSADVQRPQRECGDRGCCRVLVRHAPRSCGAADLGSRWLQRRWRRPFGDFLQPSAPRTIKKQRAAWQQTIGSPRVWIVDRKSGKRFVRLKADLEASGAAAWDRSWNAQPRVVEFDLPLSRIQDEPP
jgi:hypothetical protein